MKRPLVFLPLLVLLSACVTGPQVHTYKAPFDESQFRPYIGDGTAGLSGQAFVKDKGGKTVYAAGNEVILIPVTDYTREWYQVGVVGGKLVDRFDSQIGKYLRFTRADAEGKFQFRNVPAGQYYAATDMSWVEPDSGIQHATACATVFLEEGKTAEAKVTRP